MGFTQGDALREQIAGARRVLAELEAFRLRRPWWLPYPAFLRLAERKAKRMLAGALAVQAPEMAQRLEGIARGAGIGLPAACLLNALEVFMSSVGNGRVPTGSGACSAVAVRGRRSATGEPVLAHNFDYLSLVQPFYVLRESRPEGLWRSLDFTAAPLCGTVDGLNERGLAITNNYAYPVDAGPPAMPISMLAAGALAHCATVTEATEWITSRPRSGGGILMLADAAGDVASLELSNTRSRLRRPDEGCDLLFHTNAFFCKVMREVEVGEQTVYGPDAPAAVRGVRVLDSPRRRDERIAELTARVGTFSPEELAALMADHGPQGRPDANTLCMHSDYWHTTACLQLFPRSRRMRVAYAPACQARYEEFGL